MHSIYNECEKEREAGKGRGRTLGNEIIGNFNFLLCFYLHKFLCDIFHRK